MNTKTFTLEFLSEQTLLTEGLEYSSDEDGKLVKSCFAKLTLECGKIDSCDNKELADILVKFATDLLIEARELEKQDLEED